MAVLWDQRARILVSYVPSGFPNSIEGIEPIVSGFRHLFAQFGTYEYTIHSLYPALEPGVVVVQWDVEATVPAKGIAYRRNNVTILEFREGKIVEHHDLRRPA